MSYIGTGANRLSDIAARCNEPATNLSRPLKKLIDLRFLEKDVPFGIDEKNAKKSLYKIADPFMAFYYQFVVPNRSFIELDRRLPMQHIYIADYQRLFILIGTTSVFTSTQNVGTNAMCCISQLCIYVLYRLLSAILRNVRYQIQRVD